MGHVHQCGCRKRRGGGRSPVCLRARQERGLEHVDLIRLDVTENDGGDHYLPRTSRPACAAAFVSAPCFACTAWPDGCARATVAWARSVVLILTVTGSSRSRAPPSWSPTMMPMLRTCCATDSA